MRPMTVTNTSGILITINEYIKSDTKTTNRNLNFWEKPAFVSLEKQEKLCLNTLAKDLHIT